MSWKKAFLASMAAIGLNFLPTVPKSTRKIGDTRNYTPRKPQPHGRGKKGKGW